MSDLVSLDDVRRVAKLYINILNNHSDASKHTLHNNHIYSLLIQTYTAVHLYIILIKCWIGNRNNAGLDIDETQFHPVAKVLLNLVP